MTDTYTIISEGSAGKMVVIKNGYVIDRNEFKDTDDLIQAVQSIKSIIRQTYPIYSKILVYDLYISGDHIGYYGDATTYNKLKKYWEVRPELKNLDIEKLKEICGV